MQKRWPPRSRGPSSKRWPRWPPQRAQVTSVRTIPCERSSCSSTASAIAGSVKLGQPDPESNLVPELNRSAPHPPHLYIPVAFSWVYLPVNGGSVAAWRSTAYWSGASSSRHWSSVLAIFSMRSLSGVCGHTLRRTRFGPSPVRTGRYGAAVYTRTEGHRMPHKTRYIFVTGGVVSSLGKGIAAASLGRLLVSRGLTVGLQKFDPYINVD